MKHLYAAVMLLMVSTTIMAMPVPDTCDVPLVQGWNLVGSTVNQPVQSFFKEPEKILSVWKWDSALKTWMFHAPVLPDGGLEYAHSKGFLYLNGVRAHEGVWVNAILPTSFSSCMSYETLPPSPQ